MRFQLTASGKLERAVVLAPTAGFTRPLIAGVFALLGFPIIAAASILWSDLGSTLAFDSGVGTDILGGSIQRDDSSSDTLYFKFHIDPLSDVATEEYMAGLQLFEGSTERLGIGNALQAWAYSAFYTAGKGEANKVFGDYDLKSSRPDPSSPGVFLPYELPRRGIESTLVFKVQYVPGGDDHITVWLNPDLAPGASEASQPESLTTTFNANASFNQIRLRHTGGGGGWTFSDIAIATSFNDFVTGGLESNGTTLASGQGSLPFTFRTWQREQGLPQNSVHALTQTRDGYLWVGSDDGLARFDGVRFVSFGLREGLHNTRTHCLLEDRLGALWIGTAGSGLTRWQNGRFTTLTIADGLPAESITALAEDSDGRLWVGTEAGLAVWQNERLTVPPAAKQFLKRPITTLFKDRHGILWLGAAGAGVFRFAESNFVALTEPSVESLLLDSHCLLVDRADRIWIGAGDDFVLCRESGEWHRYRIPRHLARPYISALAEEPDGTVWAGSVSEGLFQFKAGKLAAVNASGGLSDNLVESLLVDRESNLWVGTGAGLTRLRRKTLITFGPAEGLGYGAVRGLAEVGPGVIWVAKPGEGIYHWEGRDFNRFPAPASSPTPLEINSLLVARDGSSWLGARQGVLHFTNTTSAPIETAPTAFLTNLNVISLAEDHEGALWAGTEEGQLWRLRSQNWTMQSNPAPTHPVTALVQDLENSMWVGTVGAGLFRVKGGQLAAHFDKRAGLLSDSIRTLHLDSSGVLWIGTSGGGLSRWHDGRLATFTSREGLPDNTISQILEDDNGRLWLGNNRGICCVHKSELEELTAGKITAIYPQVYGRAEGMLSEECTGGFFPAGLKTKSGLLWFSTLKGVVMANPHPQKADAPPPAVMLEDVIVDGVQAELSENGSRTANQSASSMAAPSLSVPSGIPAAIRIAPGKHRLEFHYTGLSFSAPERVRFRYRLQGLDSDWLEADTRRVAFYTYVPPGNYRFQVLACNSDGIWNPDGASVALTVLPHLWQAWWFLVAVALAFVGGIVGCSRFIEKNRLKRHLKLLEQERALERERSRIAQDLHDDLGSSLTRISLLSHLAKADKDNPGLVEVHANKISQSAGQTVRALEEIVWALRPGSDSLQSLVEYIAHFANELFEGDSTRCRLDLPHDLPTRALPPEMRHNVFLIVKEALANALKHARAREVRVQAKTTGNSLEILVEDDGRGFDPQRSSDQERHGLQNMRRRTAAMRGTLEVQSSPGKGTSVRLNVKLPDETG